MGAYPGEVFATIHDCRLFRDYMPRLRSRLCVAGFDTAIKHTRRAA